MVPLETVNKTCIAPNPMLNSTILQAGAFATYLSLVGGMTVGNIALNPTVEGPVVADFILPSEVEPQLPTDVKYYLQIKYATATLDPANPEGYHCVNACLNAIRNYGVIAGTRQLYAEVGVEVPISGSELLECFEESGLDEVINQVTVPPSTPAAK